VRGRHFIVLALYLLNRPWATAAEHDLSSPYINPKFVTAVPWPGHSHWLQPWRAYQETVPARRFLEAQGVVLDGDGSQNFEMICQMLAKCGIRHARIEVGWNRIDWDDETRLTDQEDLRKRLLACKHHGIRPLILLNANSGAPGPTRFFERTLAAPAHKGNRQVELTDASDLVAGYSGFRNLTDYRASEVLITGVHGNTVTLSKPLPKDLGITGAKVEMSTLKYRPFGPPDTADYRATKAGWQRYTGTVARTAAELLGTKGRSDLGFDMEIWNELSFGSSFLTINAYYEPKFADYNQDAVFDAVVKATAEYANAHPAEFRGVRFVDGFRNTIPWPAASTQPARISALSSHPYSGRKTYPKDEQKNPSINALGERDKTVFIPIYTANFPEYYGTWLQTESVLRDMGPIPNKIGSNLHGRNTRVVNGKVVPCQMWFTEIGFAPNENGIKERQAALAMKAKTAARYECFFINKGLERIYFFSAFSGDMGLGVVKDNFIDYAKTHTEYPSNDTSYVSPMLRTLGRLVGKMKEGLDLHLTRTRTITVESLTDEHDHFQFRGDGTPQHPTLYNREVFAFLPFQVNAHKFVIPYYVMTRDVTKEFAPEKYRVRLKGLNEKGATISVYDPLSEVSIPIRAEGMNGDRLSLTLAAADYPRLLLIQENRVDPARPKK
jgi:hypothetical protein